MMRTLLVLLLLVASPVSADQAPIRLTFLEQSADGICLYEAAVHDMLVAVLLRQQQGACKSELVLP